MKKWNFLSGLTIILLLLLIVSGYSIWTMGSMTKEMSSLTSNNFDAFKNLRQVRDVVVEADTVYRTAVKVEDLKKSQPRVLVLRAKMKGHTDTLLGLTLGPQEIEQSQKLSALGQEYFLGFDDLFQLKEKDDETFHLRVLKLTDLSKEIFDITGRIFDLNMESIAHQREAAMVKAHRSVIITMGIAMFSITIYIYTSYRLTQGIFQPLRGLRDAILRVSHRQFDQEIPVQGSEELGQIALTFNQMAAQLRTYLAETDEKARQASGDCTAILEALPYPVFIVDLEFNVRLANPRAEALAGMLGVTGTLPAVVRAQIDDAAGRGTDMVNDHMHRAIEIAPNPAKEGEHTTAYLPQIFRINSEKGKRTGWAVLLVDVTRLRRLDEAKTKALATLGHEVKTPVTSIRMTLHLLLEEKIGPLTADQRELVQAGRDDCERLLRVLQALLELARLESGRTRFNLTPNSPNQILIQAAAMNHELAKQSGKEIVVEPAAEESDKVLADMIHAGRVLTNFISNAVKYGAPGKPIRLTITDRADGYVRLGVRNYGDKPFSEVEQIRIFDPFYRRNSGNEEGTGLGLTIAREIAHAHGGRVGVWCEEGVVKFYLDLRKAPKSSNPPFSEPPAHLAQND